MPKHLTVTVQATTLHLLGQADNLREQSTVKFLFAIHNIFFSFPVILNACFRQQRNMDAQARKGRGGVRVVLSTPATRAVVPCGSEQLACRITGATESLN